MKTYYVLLITLSIIIVYGWSYVFYIHNESQENHTYSDADELVLQKADTTVAKSNSYKDSAILADLDENQVIHTMVEGVSKNDYIYEVMAGLALIISPLLFLSCYSLGWFLFFYKEKYREPKWLLIHVLIYLTLFILLITFLDKALLEDY